MAPVLRDATEQLLESLSITAQLQHVYRLLDCRRRTLLISSAVENQEVALESDDETNQVLLRSSSSRGP